MVLIWFNLEFGNTTGQRLINLVEKPGQETQLKDVVQAEPIKTRVRLHGMFNL